MKLNYNTVWAGKVAALVPYRPEHVVKYNEWMADPKIQEMTETEPFSIEEEYKMQQEWYQDEMTFIVLDVSLLTDGVAWKDQLQAMAGDVNLFFENDEDDATVAEIMVAEEKCRRKGIAKEACAMVMKYAMQMLDKKRFRAKILDYNAESIQLFTKLNYRETRRVEAFHEVHMEWNQSADDLTAFIGGDIVVSDYDESVWRK